MQAKKVEKSEIFMIFELQTVPNFRLGDENFRKNHVPMSQKALFINLIHIKQKFIKSFKKVKKCEPKKSKNRKFS